MNSEADDPPTTNSNSGNQPQTAKHIDGLGFTADIEWDKQGLPVLYVVGRGSVDTPREALAVIEAAVQMINASPFDHVCTVYNMLELNHLPMMARFIKAGNFPSSPKTAHIIIVTHSHMIQLIASLSAVMGSRRLRTMEACRSQEEIDQAVKRWLSSRDRTRAYTVNDI